MNDLVNTLIKEHREIRNLLKELYSLIVEERYAELSQKLENFQPYLDQHVIDEEARILKAILEKYGREGAEGAIRVFQEHRLIHELIREMKAVASDKSELARKGEELRALLERHFRAEEEEVFPKALDAGKKK
ncbi:MAG: hemerythrin domain-containing protein [Nitrososphaerota archaeon]